MNADATMALERVQSEVMGPHVHPLLPRAVSDLFRPVLGSPSRRSGRQLSQPGGLYRLSEFWGLQPHIPA